MRIEHIAMWVEDLERVKSFYGKYFGAISNEKYHNQKTNFQSYFLRFEDGCKLEIMYKPGIIFRGQDYETSKFGFVHFAISVGGKKQVDTLIRRLEADGYKITGQPRMTGDGFYEGVILDPENNIIEITE